MGEFEIVLRRHRRVGLDTPVFIYQFEASPRYSPATAILFDVLERGEISAVTSVLTVLELTVTPLSQTQTDVADENEMLVANFPNLLLIDIDRSTARRAVELRAKYRLASADAIQVAAALLNDATAFITNDKDLRRIEEMEVLTLDELTGG